jgi:p-aminobenzoyl-glutamate transporter AbgT
MGLIRQNILLIICFFCFNYVNGQQFLQIETINDPQTQKYNLGETIKIKKKDSNEWQSIRMLKFLYNDNVIVYDEGFLNINDIEAIRETRPVVNILSKMMMTFGAVWLVYGGLSGQLDRDPVSGYADLAIGTSSLVAGWGIGKAFYKRDYKIGSRYKLRLLDLRMSSQE